jgi:hypothetical protein
MPEYHYSFVVLYFISVNNENHIVERNVAKRNLGIMWYTQS